MNYYLIYCNFQSASQSCSNVMFGSECFSVHDVDDLCEVWFLDESSMTLLPNLSHVAAFSSVSQLLHKNYNFRHFQHQFYSDCFIELLIVSIDLLFLWADLIVRQAFNIFISGNVERWVTIPRKIIDVYPWKQHFQVQLQTWLPVYFSTIG